MCCENLSVENPQSSALPAIQPSRTRKPVTASPPQTLRYLLLALCLALPCPLFAQQSGAINGAVTDESGGAIPNAQVTVTNTGQGTVFKTATNNAGEYSAPALEAWYLQPADSSPGLLRSSRPAGSCCASPALSESTRS